MLALGVRSDGVFSDVEVFVAMLQRAVSDHAEEFDATASLAYPTKYWCRRFTPIYIRNGSRRMDYAIRCLPDTVTSTYTYLLSNDVPMPCMLLISNFKECLNPHGAPRRHSSFALDHGKLLVVMREKFSEVLDFVSLLCCHLHKSAK
jgi:hypothetical protein